MKVLLTAIGSPGGIPSIRALKREGVTVIGADARDDVAAARMVDEFHRLPRGDEKNYAIVVEAVIDSTRPDALLPGSEIELPALAWDMGRWETKVLVPSKKAVYDTMNKAQTYFLLRDSSVNLPRFYVCNTRDDLLLALAYLTDKQEYAVIKPLTGKGARGVRIIVPEVNRLTAPWREWPAPIIVTWNEIDRYADTLNYPLMAMEYLPGDVREAVDAYCCGGEILCGYVRCQRQIVHGLHSRHWIVDDPELMEQAREIVRRLNLDYFVNIQFKARKLLEVHARRSTIVVTDKVNLYWLGLRHALGLATADELRAARVEPGWHSEYYFDLCHWRS